MARYLISYDLSTKVCDPTDFDELFAAIEELGQAAHVLESVWIVESDLRPDEVEAILLPIMHEEDRVLVARFSQVLLRHNLLERDF
ncbi:hypothetical protein JXA88_16560 [Candidatus Fermentibacteria bacterium]|nr:hypothetical protein [Candidatus Fermentibacteria bacterium]